MIIPSFIRFGYSINSWIWMVVLFAILVMDDYLNRELEQFTPILIQYPIILILISIGIIISIVLDILLVSLSYDLCPKCGYDEPIKIKIPYIGKWLNKGERMKNE